MSIPSASPRFPDCYVAFDDWKASRLTRPHGSPFPPRPSPPIDTRQSGASDSSRPKSWRPRHTHQIGWSHSPCALWVAPVSSQESGIIRSSWKKTNPAHRSGRFHCWLSAGLVTNRGQRVKASRSKRRSSLAERLRQSGGFPQECRARQRCCGSPWSDVPALSRRRAARHPPLYIRIN